MKQIIRKRLCIVILTAMLTTLLINYYIEIHNAQNEMYTSAREMFWQVFCHYAVFTFTDRYWAFFYGCWK